MNENKEYTFKEAINGVVKSDVVSKSKGFVVMKDDDSTTSSNSSKYDDSFASDDSDFDVSGIVELHIQDESETKRNTSMDQFKNKEARDYILKKQVPKMWVPKEKPRWASKDYRPRWAAGAGVLDAS